jgi:enterobactin synthetase component D / holo-[acyl-carrier protein] synthase
MTVGRLMSSVLPNTGPEGENLACAEVYSDPPGLAPMPDEEPLIARSVAKRRNEFITVRHCARIALGQLGLPPVPILKGDKGEPCWPDGVVGSLTHCAGFRGAVVARSTVVRSVGIDAEPHDVLPDGVLDVISLEAERREMETMTTLPTGMHWDRVLFCAKEATYKAWFPLTQRWLGFEDAHITFDVDGSGSDGSGSDGSGSDGSGSDGSGSDGSGSDGATGGFLSTILVDGAALSGPPLTAMRGRWSINRGLVLTAIVL